MYSDEMFNHYPFHPILPYIELTLEINHITRVSLNRFKTH